MRGQVLAKPVFTGAVAVLAVNDHFLKPLIGTWWTGKLSDFAGVFVATILVGVVTGRTRMATMAVGVGFASIKLVPVAAVLAAPVLGGVTRQDPTDLVALVMLIPAVSVLRPYLDEKGEARPAPSHHVLRAGSAVAAFLVATATSCETRPAVDAFVVPGDGSVIARIYAEEFDGARDVPKPMWAMSEDGGSTWEQTRNEPPEPVDESGEACSSTIGCFRLRDEQVEQRLDGSETWRTSFTFTPEQRRRLRIRADFGGCDTDRVEFKAITVVDRPDGEHVVVAMGSQGVLHRLPDGEWERRAVLDRRPISLSGPSWLHQLRLLPLALILLSPVLLFVGAAGSGRGFIALAVALAGGVALLVGSLMFIPVLDYTLYGPVIAVASLGVFAASLVVALSPRRRFRAVG